MAILKLSLRVDGGGLDLTWEQVARAGLSRVSDRRA